MKSKMKIYRTNKVTKDDIGRKVEVVRSFLILRKSLSLQDMLEATLYKTTGAGSETVPGIGTIGELKNVKNGYVLVQIGSQEFIYSERGVEVVGKGRMKDIW